MTIHFVDEGDTWFRILVGAGNDPIPNIGSEDHPRSQRFFNRARGKICIQKRLAVAKRYCRSIRTSINDVFAVANWIEDRLVPGLAVELQLKPLIVIDSFQKLVSNVD